MVFSGSLLLVAVVCAASLVSGRLLTGALGLDLLGGPAGSGPRRRRGLAVARAADGRLLDRQRHLHLLRLQRMAADPRLRDAVPVGSRLAGHHDPLAVAAAAVPAGGRLPARPRAGGLGCPLVVARVSGGQRLRDGPPGGGPSRGRALGPAPDPRVGHGGLSGLRGPAAPDLLGAPQWLPAADLRPPRAPAGGGRAGPKRSRAALAAGHGGAHRPDHGLSAQRLPAHRPPTGGGGDRLPGGRSGASPVPPRGRPLARPRRGRRPARLGPRVL